MSPTPPPPPPPPPPAPPPPPVPSSSTINNGSSVTAAKAPSEQNKNVLFGNEKYKNGQAALSPSQLRECRKAWSLAGDAGLLLYLQEFSQRFVSKTTEIGKLVEQLADSTKGSNSKIQNTFNDFLMLSSNQFIENRVYDEDIGEEKSDKDTPEKVPKTREQLEGEILDKYSQAVSYGLHVLDDAFITVEVKANEDSDDDDGSENLAATAVADPIIEPKDSYSARPLPHIIGTAEFFYDDTLGLIELLSDEETAKEVEESDVDTDESDYSDKSQISASGTDEDFDFCSIENERERKDLLIDESDGAFASEESDSDDLFGEPKRKKKVESISSKEINRFSGDESEGEKENAKVDIHAELHAKLGLGFPSEAERRSIKSRTDSISSKKSQGRSNSSAQSERHKKSKKTKGRNGNINEDAPQHRSSNKVNKKNIIDDDEDLFGPKKIESDYEDDIFSKKSNLFGGGSSLFDEPEDEGDLFGDAVGVNEVLEDHNDEPTLKVENKADTTPISHQKRTSSSGKKIPAGAVSVFGDIGSGFIKPQSTMSDSKVKQDESKSAPSSSKPPPAIKGLFDDDEDEENEDLQTQTNLNRNKTLDTKDHIPQRKKSLELFNDDDDDLFNPAQLGKKEKVVKTASEKKNADEHKSIKKNGGHASEKALTENKQKDSVHDLFGDEEDSLFGNAPQKSSSNEVKPQIAMKKEEKKKNIISLFDDDDEDESEDDGIFSHIKANTTTAERQPSPSIPSKQIISKPVKAASLFDDEDDLFASPPSHSIDIAKDKTIAAKNSSEPTAPSNEIFSTASEAKKEKSNTQLFEDDSSPAENAHVPDASPTESKKAAENDFKKSVEESDDLFAPIPSSKERKEKELKPKVKSSMSIFGDDEEEEEDELIFSIPPSIKKAEKPQSKKDVDNSAASGNQIDQPVKHISKNSLFDDNDDDLFSTTSSSGKSKDELNSVTEKSAEAVQTKGEDDKEIKQKKPAGGISLFGGIDPFSAKKNLKSTGKSAIFDDSDDEVDGLFSTGRRTNPSKAKLPKPVQTKKPAVTVTKLEASSDPLSLFDDSPQLKEGKVPQVTEASSVKAIQPPFTANSESETKSVVKKSSIKSLQSTLNFNPSMMLPGAAPVRKKSKNSASSLDKPTEEKTEGSVPKVTKPEATSGSSSLFDDSSQLSEGEVSQVTKATSVKATQSPVTTNGDAETKRSTKTGGIKSLQNTLNLNPSMLLPGAAPVRKKSKSSVSSLDEPADEITQGNVSKGTKSEASSGPLSLFGDSSQLNEGEVSQVTEVSSVKATQPPGTTNGDAEIKHSIKTGGIKSLQNTLNLNPSMLLPGAAPVRRKSKNSVSSLDEPTDEITQGNVSKITLNFNPAAMLPGASPPKKQIKRSAASFDEPADVKTLGNISKARVRVQGKRRPPTRKTRDFDITDGNALWNDTSIDDNKSSSRNISNEYDEVDASIPSSSTDDILRKSTNNDTITDIFGEDDDEIIPSSKNVETIDTDKDIQNKSDHNEFSVKTDSLSQTGNEDQLTSKKLSNDIFSSGNNDSSAKDIALDKKKSVVLNGKPSTSCGDIFENKATSDDDLFSDTTDIFFTPRQSVERTSPGNSKSSDELFSDTVDKKNKTLDLSANGNQDKVGEVNQVFSDDDELFSTKPKKKKEKKKTSLKFTDDDLFGTSGSIFDDLPSKKEKKKKQKKKNDDAIEDIFAT